MCIDEELQCEADIFDTLRFVDHDALRLTDNPLERCQAGRLQSLGRDHFVAVEIQLFFGGRLAEELPRDGCFADTPGAV